MLYHSELGFPNTLIVKDYYEIELFYSRHAIKASVSDRYGKIQLPSFISFNREEIIEIETFDNIKVNKILVRIDYSEDLDLCLVILTKTNVVKTVWLNKKKISILL